jgi:hypothetical protein
MLRYTYIVSRAFAFKEGTMNISTRDNYWNNDILLFSDRNLKRYKDRNIPLDTPRVFSFSTGTS